MAMLLLPGGGLQAQAKKIPADYAPVRVRSMPANALQKYRDDEAFDYGRQHAEGMSLWERFWRWVGESMEQISNNTLLSVIYKMLLWGLCIFALVYAILKFTGMQGVGLFAGNKKAEELDYSVTEDNIYAINFNEAIGKAVADKNHRVAIRLLYLQTLRKLADRELIRWKLNKTNDIYLQELAGGNFYKDFAYLTYAYDYAWYGDFPVQEEQFNTVQQYFKNFQRQLPG